MTDEHATTSNLAALRAGAYLLDLLPTLPFLLFALIPFVGATMAAVFLAPYWLLRDALGISLGKRLLKLEIVDAGGRPAGRGARVLRNVPIAAGWILCLIPIVGVFVAVPVAFILILVETILVVVTGQRIGDRVAHTEVRAVRSRRIAAVA